MAAKWKTQEVVVERSDQDHKYWAGVIRMAIAEPERSATYAWTYQCYDTEDGTECHLNIHPGQGPDTYVPEQYQDSMSVAITEKLAGMYD